MPWLTDRSYSKALDRLGNDLRAGGYHFRTTERLVFLCGGVESTRRGHVDKFLNDSANIRNLKVFQAENVWDSLGADSGFDLLQVESLLGQVADVVIVIVESPGTFAELGAFVQNEKLSPKLLLVMDEHFRSNPSFINHGPIRYFERKSGTRSAKFAPVVYADFSVITECYPELRSRLQKLPGSGRFLVRNFDLHPKFRLFLLCDMVSLIGPAKLSHVHYLSRITELELSEKDLQIYLELATCMEFLDCTEMNGQRYYRRSLNAFELFHIPASFDPATSRAQLVGSLLRIPEAREVLSELA